MAPPFGRLKTVGRLKSAAQLIPYYRRNSDEVARDLFWGEAQDQTFTQGSTAYLLRDKFTANQNPLTDGNASEGAGVGYRDVTGTGFYAAGGRLRGGNSTSGQITYRPSSDANGWYRVGGRTFCALVAPDDGDGNVSLWLAQTNGQLNGYGLRVDNKTVEIVEPDGNTVTALLVDGAPGKAIQYLMGITLNEGRGAVYWISAIGSYTPTNEWAIPQYPSARTLFVSTLGDFTTVYPTVYASSGFSYPGGVSIEDVRLLDVPGWTGNDGLALVADRFDRGALGSSWTADAGTWDISNNQAYSSSAAFNGRTWRNAGQSNVWVVAEVTSGTNLGDWFGLLLRRVDANNWIRLYNNGTANIYLQTWVAGGFDDTVVATYAAFATSQTKRWLVGANGDYYRVFLNGDETVIQPTIDTGVTHEHTNGTGFGLFGDSASGQRWDYFAVYPITLSLPSALQAGEAPVQPVVAVPVLSDTFTNTNGTALSTHNAAWSTNGGTWTVESNRAQGAGASGQLHAYRDAGRADVQASVSVVMPASVAQIRAGLTLRRTDTNNLVRVRCLVDDVNQLNNDEIEVVEVIGGSATVVHKCYLGNYFQPNTAYTLTAQVVGDELFVYLDGVPQLYVVLSNAALLTGTGVGLYREGGSDNATFDAFTVTQAGAQVPPAASIGLSAVTSIGLTVPPASTGLSAAASLALSVPGATMGTSASIAHDVSGGDQNITPATASVAASSDTPDLGLTVPGAGAAATADTPDVMLSVPGAGTAAVADWPDVALTAGGAAALTADAPDVALTLNAVSVASADYPDLTLSLPGASASASASISYQVTGGDQTVTPGAALIGSEADWPDLGLSVLAFAGALAPPPSIGLTLPPASLGAVASISYALTGQAQDVAGQSTIRATVRERVSIGMESGGAAVGRVTGGAVAGRTGGSVRGRRG